jgi:arylsulfatase A-like enzyme
MENQTTTPTVPTANDPQADRPNIIMIMVDQMRFPMHFPPGIGNADEFIEKYMPNLFKYIWSKGVRFANHYIAASDCTAGRATIYTGLYAYQTYLMLTLITFPELPESDSGAEQEDDSEQQGLFQPQLQTAFPTLGHLLRDAGYDTPYFGKWHMSYRTSNLERYGFDSHVPVGDLPGLYGQGLKYDEGIAEDAAQWVQQRVASKKEKPFFLSVNFVNPHDKQFFWGGTEVTSFNTIYANIETSDGSIGEKSAQTYAEPPPKPEDAPPSYGYTSDVREFLNWESSSQLSQKPGVHTLVREVFQYQMGGIYDDSEAADYTPVYDLLPEQYWSAPTKLKPEPQMHKALAAFEYWSKALDSYIQIMQMVDDSIGTFMAGLPEEIRDNSVFVFTSDHGEYASSHGLQGKGGTIYEEGILVPFVVVDPTGRFTSSTEQYRTQLTSSVDMLPMIVSMGHGGSNEWLHENEDYEQLWGSRHDLLKILHDPDAPGRQYVLHTTDEFLPSSVNYLHAPMHVIGTIFQDSEGNKQKLGVYTLWKDFNSEQSQATVLYTDPHTQLEYYNHRDRRGALELESSPDSDAAQNAIALYWGTYPAGPSLVLEELQAALPTAYQEAQKTAYQELQAYMQILNKASEQDQTEGDEKPAAAVRDPIDQRTAQVWSF